MDRGCQDPAGAEVSYDFKDHMIRNMIMRDHQPTESWEYVEPGYEPGSRITCQADSLLWPCPSMKAMLEYDQEQQKAHHIRMAEGGYQNEPSPW